MHNWIATHFVCVEREPFVGKFWSEAPRQDAGQLKIPIETLPAERRRKLGIGRQAFVRLIIHTLLQMLLLLLLLLLIIIHIPSDVLLFRAARGFSPWMRVEGRKWRRGTACDVRKGILCTEALANTFLGHYTPPPLLPYVDTATAGWLSEQVLVLLLLLLLLWYTWTELKNTRSEFVP